MTFLGGRFYWRTCETQLESGVKNDVEGCQNNVKMMK